MQVSTATADDAAEWDAALPSLAGATFYHRFGWRAVNEESFGHRSTYVLARANGRVCGVLPLTLVSSRLFGRILCSMPFVNLGGPCGTDSSVAQELLGSALELARGHEVDYVELRCRSPIDCDLPVSLRKISMVISLQPDPEAAFGAYSAKHRTNIRRAQKNDLSVEAGGRELIPEFYRVMEHSWRELGTPFYAREYFERIMAEFPEAARIFVCRRHGKAIATALNGYFCGTVEGLWNGGVAESRTLGANYVLYWEMIRDACERGFTRFHLGRSTAGSSAEDFKRKWNADRHQLYWYYWRRDGAPMPNLNVDNPRFALAIKAWRHMPLAVTRVIGPRLARGIP
jgi:FemAB-related protein (PEP-CTERM system-associated)